MERENGPLNSLSSCCISHHFYTSASTNSHKVAVIRAHGGTRLKRRRIIQNDRVSEDEPYSSHHHDHGVYDGDRCFTYSELLSAVDCLSSRIWNIIDGGDVVKHTSGITPKIIAVYMVPSVEYIVAVLSILRCGQAFVPLDPSWPNDRILHVLSSTNVNLVIGSEYFDKNNNTQLIKNSNLLLNSFKWPVLRVSMDELIEQEHEKLGLIWPCENRVLRKFSYLMYTSGSSGKPKGVCGREEGILNRFLWMQELYPLRNDDVLLFKTSISFIDHVQEFLAPMLVGCTLVVPLFDHLRENLFSLVDAIHDYGISRLTVVPSLIRAVLPMLESIYLNKIQCSLRLLVLSGESFPVSLWRKLSEVLPSTCILNIYGSTEVSGDCTYFDCKRLLEILESEMLPSVPIGTPISNCDVRLVEENGKSCEGEIFVTGICVSSGYYSDCIITPFDSLEFPRDDSVNGNKLGFKTGDFARRIATGDLIFIGRKDRMVKINGQRIALEEVEETLRGHPDIADAAVVLCNNQTQYAFLGAVLLLKKKDQSSEVSGSLRAWISDKLPSAMIPKEFIFTDALPKSSTGKVDYALLSGSFSTTKVPNETGHLQSIELLDRIRHTFHNALNVAEFGTDDDFFKMGGDSIAAAHVAYDLNIDMRLLYLFPTASKLRKALLEREGLFENQDERRQENLPKSDKGKFLNPFDSKRLKVEPGSYSLNEGVISIDRYPWKSNVDPISRIVTRCNKVVNKENTETNVIELPRNIRGALRKLWKVPMGSCVDASAVIAFNHGQILIFIGSHSRTFLCVDAKSGCVKWKINLDGRIECSAVVDGDSRQVIVGCYKGKIYFIDISNGNIRWTFQTQGEVKSQPALDQRRRLIWCGSHDHNLYALNYRNHRLVYKLECGGSIFGSPTIDEDRDTLYVGTTTGRLTAISLTDSAFSTSWVLELEAPIFASLSLSYNGNVICCLVNGHVLCITDKGYVLWRGKTDGPIFAGPSISRTLGSQAIVCSRNGRIYSFDLENGNVIWEYDTGDPVTSSVFVDENIELVFDSSTEAYRLICTCSSSGRIHLLRTNVVKKGLVEKFAELDLDGNIFSSPVMIGGRVFVGCRDDYLHCVVAEAYVDKDS